MINYIDGAIVTIGVLAMPIIVEHATTLGVLLTIVVMGWRLFAAAHRCSHHSD